MAEKLIVIGGGVGSGAGVKLQQYIVDNISATGDQGHFEAHHFCRPQIGDRTLYL